MTQLSSVWVLVMAEVQEDANNLEIMREALGQMIVGDIERDAFTEVLMKSMDSDQSEYIELAQRTIATLILLILSDINCPAK